ncbi:MAG: SH3 domain-containing protein [Bacteroidia bacterium]|nr:SH3 domain-containing protein [Bacteroidia bacterium]MDW8236617.1 SH3 domain-containing protein [Bacteroidia bacterium]
MRIRAILILGTLGGCGPRPMGEVELMQEALLYSAPSLSASVLDSLPAGTIVSRLAEKGEWVYACYRGVRGWLQVSQGLSDYVPGEPLEKSLLFLYKEDSVLVAAGPEGEASVYKRLGEFEPWFAPDTMLYGGFYEGLPGSTIDLIIVNTNPALGLIVKGTTIDPETLEPKEEEYILTQELRCEGNLVFVVESEDAPFRQAEFIRWGAKRGLLLKQGDKQYAVLWRRTL